MTNQTFTSIERMQLSAVLGGAARVAGSAAGSDQLTMFLQQFMTQIQSSLQNQNGGMSSMLPMLMMMMMGGGGGGGGAAAGPPPGPPPPPPPPAQPNGTFVNVRIRR